MLHIIIAALLAGSALAELEFTMNKQVGSRSGTPYLLEGQGRITGVRVWDNGNYVYGIQFRYGFIWSGRAGSSSGTMSTLELFDGEAIIQVSGTFSTYIQSIMFVTNKGRLLMVGRHSGQSFNMYARSVTAELRFISGTLRGPLTGFAAHFGRVVQGYDDLEH